MGEGPHHEVKLQSYWDALPPNDMANLRECLAQQPAGVRLINVTEKAQSNAP